MSNMQFVDGKIEIDFDSLVKSMPEDQVFKLIKNFSAEEFVIEKVIDYICGEDEDGWWSSCNGDKRQELLEKVERSHIGKGPKYNWSVFSEAKRRLMEIKEKKHIYWALYHGLDGVMVIDNGEENRQSMSEYIFKWMKKNGIESEYNTKKADEDIKRVEQIIIDALKMLTEK